MLFKFAAIALPLLAFAQGTVASAIAARSTGPAAIAVEVAQVSVTGPVSATRVASPKVDLASLAGFPIKTTSPNTGFKSLVATLDPELVICTSQNCAGSCFEVDPFTLEPGTCFTSGIEFLSAAVVTSTAVINQALLIAISVAQAGCVDSIQIAANNICFNLELNGVSTPFIDFFTTV